MRLGVFGGSFDPVHTGHLLVAEACREGAALDRVLFVPAARAPHKPDGPRADGRHRVEMLSLAVGGHDAFAVSTVELDRGGVSYTVDTLEALRAAHPGATLHLILGPDSLAQFDTWRDPAGILARARIVAVARAGVDDVAATCRTAGLDRWLGADGVAALVAEQVAIPAVGLRSSTIRALLAAGRSIRYQVPRAVERYVAEQGLYRGAAPA